MTSERIFETYTADWEGFALSVSFEPSWLSMQRPPERMIAHLEVRVAGPGPAATPITDTGYRSHFVHPEEVAEAGGPVAYVLMWLNQAAALPEWIEHLRLEHARELASRQLSLF